MMILTTPVETLYHSIHPLLNSFIMWLYCWKFANIEPKMCDIITREHCVFWICHTLVSRAVTRAARAGTFWQPLHPAQAECWSLLTCHLCLHLQPEWYLSLLIFPKQRKFLPCTRQSHQENISDTCQLTVSPGDSDTGHISLMWAHWSLSSGPNHPAVLSATSNLLFMSHTWPGYYGPWVPPQRTCLESSFCYMRCILTLIWPW